MVVMFLFRLPTNPAIDVRMEWTGQWGDWDAGGSDVHVANIQYLEGRHQSEGLDIRSYIINDSAGDCDGPYYWVSDHILVAISQTEAFISFPVRYWSKRLMMRQNYELTGICMANGHSLQPINHVFANRYFNLICNPPFENQLVLGYAVPACLDLAGYEDQCFNQDMSAYGVPPGGSNWMVNFYSVCPAQFLEIYISIPKGYCPVLTSRELELPICLPRVLVDELSSTLGVSEYFNTSASQLYSKYIFFLKLL
jgi:hypothetical protein